MKKKKSFDYFKKNSLDQEACLHIKGGYKSVPNGAEALNFIGTAVDIRGANLQQKPKNIDSLWHSVFA